MKVRVQWLPCFWEKIKRVHRNIPVGVQKDSETLLL
jgi:hypothetical protein